MGTFNIADLFQGTLNPHPRGHIAGGVASSWGCGSTSSTARRSRAWVYSRSFNLSLIMLTMVSALVLMMISSNMALSLGMVGALSIVRFRTAIKDPIDTVFMFWAVGEGLAVGAGFLDVGLIGGLVIG